MSKLIATLLVFAIFSTSKAAISNEAWTNYTNSTYEDINISDHDDAIILFDRTYYNSDIAHESQVVIDVTIHRKIKINSLNGLEQFNKLYIPTYDDLNFTIELVNCKAKVIKNNNTSINTDKSQFVTTTLPANTPFFYKVTGNFKMLALNDISIGDEIEYIYSIKKHYNTDAENFYKSDRISFSGDHYCLEKSVFFESDIYETAIWPYNFNNEISKNANFEYKGGIKISLKNIKKLSHSPYTKTALDQPYIQYITTNYKLNIEGDSWKELARDFKPRRKDTKHNVMFDGENILDAEEQLGQLNSTQAKFELLLEKINSPLEKNFNLYDEFQDNIDVAWSYAKNISKLMKKLNMPVDFHLVVDKNYGNFDSLYISLYQFNNILISFKDENGKLHFVPLIEPYSKLDEVQLKYQDTDCFTISQSDKGDRTYSFDRIPKSDKKSIYKKEVHIQLKQSTSKRLVYQIDEDASFEGGFWLNIKPQVFNIIQDSVNTAKLLKKFIKDQLIVADEVDSIYDIQFKADDAKWLIEYKYIISPRANNKMEVIHLRLDLFVENSYNTPNYMKRNRDFPGYLYDEPVVQYIIDIDLGNHYKWLENIFLENNYENNIGAIITDYDYSNSTLNISFNQSFKKNGFSPQEWNEVLKIRDQSFNFLHTNLYFKRNN